MSKQGLPQGDASLAGAKYGIYKGNQLIDTYTTDANGQFTTKYYSCGDDWSVREITRARAICLTKPAHHIGAEAKNYTVEYNSTANDVVEQVIKGKIAIIKHTDDGETQLETPEVGAEFSVYLKSAGSYERAPKIPSVISHLRRKRFRTDKRPALRHLHGSSDQRLGRS